MRNNLMNDLRSHYRITADKKGTHPSKRIFIGLEKLFLIGLLNLIKYAKRHRRRASFIRKTSGEIPFFNFKGKRLRRR